MTELDTLRHSLAQAIAGYRIAERNANHALIVADCQIRNLANQAGLYHFGKRLMGHTITGAPIWR